MKRKDIRNVLVGLALGALTFTVISTTNAQAVDEDPKPIRITVKWCPEDAVHVGLGDFDGRWDRYACIPLDDIGAGKGSWNQDDVKRWVRHH